MRHHAYERLARTAGCANGQRPAAGRSDRRRPEPPVHSGPTAPLPPIPPVPQVPPPVADHTGDPVCARCGTWSSCCFCSADVSAMRTALRRIAEIHSSCGSDCPEVRRLAAARRR